MAVLLVRQFEIQAEKRRNGVAGQLPCCAIHGLPENLSFPPTPPSLQGKTEVPDISPQVNYQYLQVCALI